MVETQYRRFEGLLFLAAAREQFGKANMALSHGNDEAAVGEARSAFGELVRAGYSLAMLPQPGVETLYDVGHVLSDLRMEFTEIEFFDLVRDLCPVFFGKKVTDSQLEELGDFMAIIAKHVEDRTGLGLRLDY